MRDDDGELIAVGVRGEPDFLPLLHGRYGPRAFMPSTSCRAATFANNPSCNGARLQALRARANSWVKVKTAEWKAANQYRAKLFEKSTPD